MRPAALREVRNPRLMISPLTRCSLAAVALVTLACTARAQVRISSGASEEAYVEMTTEEFRNLVGKVQRLRVQRAKQYAYLRTQGEAGADAGLQESLRPPSVVPGERALDPKIAALDRDIQDLTREIALMRAEVTRVAFRQNDDGSAPAAQRLTSDYRSELNDSRRREDQARRERDRRVGNERLADRRSEVDYRLRDERARYELDLRDERERYRRLERELEDLRRDRAADLRLSVDDAQSRKRGLAYDFTPRGSGFGLNNYAPAGGGTVVVRDTVIVNREGERIVVRDTIRDTRVITREVVEPRVDLAAVLFAHNSTAITAAAAIQIDEAVSAYRRQPESQLLLRGFASRDGNARYNQDLSTRRAEAVRDRLVAAGIPTDHIRLIGNGEDPTDKLSSGRRVEIQQLLTP